MNRIELISKAVATKNPDVLFKLFEQALDLAQFNASQLALSKGREEKLKEQILRQTAMIDNLNKTLWKK